MFKSVNSSNLGQVSKSNIVLIFILKFMLLPITPDIGYPLCRCRCSIIISYFEIADILLFQSSVFASRYPQASLKMTYPSFPHIFISRFWRFIWWGWYYLAFWLGYELDINFMHPSMYILYDIYKNGRKYGKLEQSEISASLTI